MRRTLDIGCGSYPRGTVNVDIDFTWSSPWMQSEKYDPYTAPRQQICDRVKADANYSLPFRSECFDEVYLVHVIEHLLHPFNCLQDVYRVLKRRGKVIVFVPNARVNLADWRDQDHYFSFTQPTITRLVGKLFKVVVSELLFDGDDIHVVGVKE